MRRTLGILVIVVAIAACGGDDDTDGEGSAESSSATWTYQDALGDTVTVEESDSTSFTGGVPTAVSVIDDAMASGGCDSVQVELDFWVSQLDDPDVGERAGAYAQYALDVGADNGCSLTV